MYSMRRIVHLDMDAFYASVEQRDRPELRARPVAVGGSPQGRGVVAAASYEARRYGVRSAMPMARAVRLCPELAVVPPDFSKYNAVSAQVMEILRSCTDLVEPLSLDEAYLDVTENRWGLAYASSVARELKSQILERTGLTASAGVAPNKFLAKIASAWRKPDGLTVISPERMESFLVALPVDALWGVGPVTARRLRRLGIVRVLDLRKFDAALLHRELGSLADWLLQLAHGADPRPVVPHRAAKSASSETTYAQDLQEIDAIRSELARLAYETAQWLEGRHLMGRTVTIKVRYADFTTVTRSHTLSQPTSDADVISSWAAELLRRTHAGQRPVRLLGARVSNLVESGTEVTMPGA
jgi:DNA polymerase IV